MTPRNARRTAPAQNATVTGPKSHFLISDDHIVTFTEVPREQAEDWDGPVMAVYCSESGHESIRIIEEARAYYKHLRARGYMTAAEFAKKSVC